MVSKMSENTSHEILPFITKFEQVYETLVVLSELPVSLITPYFSDKCRTMLNQFTGEDVPSYDVIKDCAGLEIARECSSTIDDTASNVDIQMYYMPLYQVIVNALTILTLLH